MAWWDNDADTSNTDPLTFEQQFPNAFRRQGIVDFYQQFLGRDYDLPGFTGYYQSPLGLGVFDNPMAGTIAGSIYGSPEAQAYRSRQTASGTNGSSASDPYGYFQELIRGVDPTTQNLADIVFPKFQERFKDAKLDRGDVYLPDLGWVDVLEAAGQGGRAWQWLEPRAGGAGGGAGQFTDPLTAQYEQLLQSQIALYQEQQAQMRAQEGRRQAARQQTQVRADDLTKFLNERVEKLKGPAYTGSEADILRTQLTDPVERDRQASLDRALQNIGSRGFDPTSGVAQELLQNVNRAYDEERSRRTGGLAEAQIQEQRSREQEAQSLLQYLTQLPLAVETGDINFLNSMYDSVNRSGTNALSASGILAGLGGQRLQEAMAALGLGSGSGNDAMSAMMALLNQYTNNRNQNQNQWSNYWNNIGYSFLPEY